MLVLEPEAASFYCRHLPVQKDCNNSTIGVFESGEKYMVVDAGGISRLFTIKTSLNIQSFKNSNYYVHVLIIKI